MRISRTLTGFLTLMGATFAPGPQTRAENPIGLDAIERFDLIPNLRYGVRTYQYSSHDPSGANNDRGHYLYDDGDEHVMLDVKGPGCIYRFWFTGNRDREVRLYFDGSSTPLFAMSLQEFFSGTHAPFLAPLVGNDVVSSGGYYCYLPMPFREGCKITTKEPDIYYNITFQRFADATGVTTFTGTEDSTAARDIWNNAGTDPKPDPGQTTVTDTVDMPIGASVTMLDISSSAGIVQQLEITIPGLTPGEQSKSILSGLHLECYWDGSAQAAVDVPLGDFFGSGLGATTVAALPVGMGGQRLYCYFPMPFATAAEMKLVNSGTVGVDDVTYIVRYTTLAGPAQQVGTFHAKFLFETPTTFGRDYLMLEETGAGHFAGVVQTLYSDTLADRVYLEGDERIHVDGCLTPALYGTGTEDFYNGGWYFSHGTFTLPVHGCPKRDPPLPDPPEPLMDTCYRFFLSDLIPFTTGIHVGIEHGGHNDINADIKSVAFYYKISQPLAALTDELDVGNTSSENAHDYVATSQTWSGSRSGSYEGDDDDVSVNDNGRRLAGGSEFTVAVTPQSNGGVLLRRRMDYSFEHQEANVYADDTLAGIWYEPGENNSHIWRDSEFIIPPALTQGKDTITVRIDNTSPHSDWTEYHYWVYTFAVPEPTIGVDPEALNPLTTYEVDPPDDSFTVTNLGGKTLNYFITNNVDWLNVFPDSGSSTGEPNTLQVIYNIAGRELDLGTHNATIWVTDPNATNSPQTIPVQLTVNPIPGDFDEDFDVDQTDFGHLQFCMTGQGITQYDSNCFNARLDGDTDVDGNDLDIFLACLSGPDLPANPNCTP